MIAGKIAPEPPFAPDPVKTMFQPIRDQARQFLLDTRGQHRAAGPLPDPGTLPRLRDPAVTIFHAGLFLDLPA